MRFPDMYARDTRTIHVYPRGTARGLLKSLRIRAVPILPDHRSRNAPQEHRRGGGNPYGSRIFNDDDKGRQPFQTRSCKRLFSFHARRDRVTLRALPLFRQRLLFATELICRSNSWLRCKRNALVCIDRFA